MYNINMTNNINNYAKMLNKLINDPDYIKSTIYLMNQISLELSETHQIILAFHYFKHFYFL